MADELTVERSAAPATEKEPVADSKPQAPAPPDPQKPTAPASKTIEAGFKIPRDQIDPASLQRIEVPQVRDRIQTEFESDRGYNMIAARIIAASQRHLADQQRDKVALRKQFATLFSVLLILEYIFAVIFILLDAITAIPVDVPDATLQLYITSVFVQTLSAMGVMIAFAFVSKEETRIVGLLNQIIQNYQKVRLDPDEVGPASAPPNRPE